MSTQISVCVPAYNEEAVIAETVAEALETFDQLPGQHEILVVDDGSADRTWEIIEALAEQDGRLRVFRHPDNRGLAAAQRTLIGNAQGEYIFHIGADREWRMRELIRRSMIRAARRRAPIARAARRRTARSI